jgi:hypothetical protein
MEFGGQFYAPAGLPPEHVGHRGGLDAVEERTRPESNPCHPARSLVTALTDLPRLLH